MSKLASSRALLIVVSSPSGGGKSTLCRRLLSDDTSLRYSISCTTRPPRGGEVDGVHYHFLSRDAFQLSREKGDFLESADVHGQFYGTLAEPVRSALASGKGIVMAIDVQGAAQIRAQISACPVSDPLRQAYLDIFILPPSLHVLEARLRKRAEDSEEVIQRRLKNAIHEIQESDKYQYRVMNDDLDVAYHRLRDIVALERNRVPDAGGQ